MLSATPARQRSTLSQSHPPFSARSQATTRATGIPEMPEYEPPEAPLTAEALRKISTLLHSQHLRHLRTHLQNASEKLTETAGDVNERFVDARVRYERLRQRRRDAGEDEEEGPGSGSERLDEQEHNVQAVTGRLEEKMRQMIDSEARLQNLLESMTKIEKEEGEAQVAALGVRQTRAQQRRQQRANRDDEGGDGGDERDDTYEGTPEREARERNIQNPPSRRLDESLEEGNSKWNELSLTERYATNNSYIGFYRMVHDSKFPGDEVPPLPHSSTWFSHLEDTSAWSGGSTAGPGHRSRSTRNQREPSADSDDIAIERERISLKCPLTLLPFRDPVTSTKCPHSFEREAIHDMIERSNFNIPPPPGQGGRRIRAVKCPVCSIPLTSNDLRSDPVLLRKVRRAEELSAREAEDQLDGSQQQSDGPNRVLLASDAVDADATMEVDVDDDSDDDSDEPRVKSEPVGGREDSEEESAEDVDMESD